MCVAFSHFVCFCTVFPKETREIGEKRGEKDKRRLWLRQNMNAVSFKGFPVLEFRSQRLSAFYLAWRLFNSSGDLYQKGE